MKELLNIRNENLKINVRLFYNITGMLKVYIDVSILRCLTCCLRKARPENWMVKNSVI
jgi:hypothetical protein